MSTVPQCEPITLSGDGLVLRPWSLTNADIAAVLQAAQDPDIARYSSVGSAITPR